VRMWQLGQQPPNNVAQQIGSHDAPIKSVGFLQSSNLVVTGGWDAKLKVRERESEREICVCTIVGCSRREVRSQLCTYHPHPHFRCYTHYLSFGTHAVQHPPGNFSYPIVSMILMYVEICWLWVLDSDMS
jgi:hypothetical protein